MLFSLGLGEIKVVFAFPVLKANSVHEFDVGVAATFYAANAFGNGGDFSVFFCVERYKTIRLAEGGDAND